MKTILLLIPSVARNPLVRLYINALKDEYRLMIACEDVAEATARFPAVEFVSLSPRVFSSGRKPAGSAAARNQAAVPQGCGTRPDKTKKIDFGFLRGMLSTAVRCALHCSKLPKPDVILAVDGDTIAIARFLSLRWRVPFIYVIYEVWPNQFPWTSPIESHSMAILEGMAIRSAALTLVCHRRFSRMLSGRYRISPRKFRDVYPCPPLPKLQSAREVGSPLKLYYHGAYTAARGLETLIEAMAGVQGAHLYMRGIGPFEPQLKAMAEQMQLTDKVTFMPALPADELVETAGAFDIGLVSACPTAANGRFLTGFKTFENIAAGLAIVSSRSWVITDVLRDFGVGMAFDGGCAKSLGEVLRFCAANPAQVAEWKAASRAVAAAELNADAQAARLREIMSSFFAGR